MSNLRRMRKAHGMTVTDLQRASGVSHGHISDIENGKKVPGLAVAKRLAKALGTTVDELFPDISVNEQASTSELTA
jgi:putative transcriptional regulator